MKICTACNKDKETLDFHPDKSGRDGFRSTCKECTNKRIADKRELRSKGIGIKEVKEKECNKCKQIKPISMFYKDIANIDGHYSMCKPCKPCKTTKTMEWRTKNTEKYNKSQQNYSKANPEMRYGVQIKRRYGCTLEQYNQMLINQKGACYICQSLHNPAKKKGRLYVDHCHKTGKVRALLCHHCNCMLGYAKDNIEVLLKAVEYLRKNEGSFLSESKIALLMGQYNTT